MALGGSNLYVVWTEINSATTPPTQDIFFAKSNDHGATFSSAANLSNDGVSQFARLAISGTSDGTVYVVWSDGGAILFRKSSDGGATFGNVITLGMHNTGGAVPQIAVSGNNIYVVWDRTNPVGGTRDVFYTSSTDGGTTWANPPVNLSNNGLDADSTSVFAQVLALGKNVVVVWSQTTGSGPEFVAEASADGGATFGTSQVISGTDFGAKTAIHSKIGPSTSGSNNNVYVLWDEFSPDFTKSDVFFATSLDGGATWSSSPTNLSNNGMSTHSQMDPPSPGHVLVVWNTLNFATNRADVFFTKSVDGGATFSPPLNMSKNGHSANALIADPFLFAAIKFLDFQCLDPSCFSSNDDVGNIFSSDGGDSWLLPTKETSDHMSQPKDLGLDTPLFQEDVIMEHQVSSTNPQHEVVLAEKQFTLSCTNDSQCSPEGFCNPSTNTCQAKLGNGNSCSGANQCISGDCSGGICVQPSTCTDDSQCPGGDFCTSGNTCQAKSGNGGTCSRDGQCTSGLCKGGTGDNSGTGGTCQAPSPVTAKNPVQVTVKENAKDFPISLDGHDSDSTDDVSFECLTLPAHGTLVGCDGGKYTPFKDFAGIDSFTYRVHDISEPSQTVDSTVDITVQDTSKPVADGQTIPLTEPFPSSIPITLTGSDPDASTDLLGVGTNNLEFQLASQASHGTAVVSSSGAATYTPVAGFEGTDSFTFITIEPDGIGGSVTSDPAAVTITVTNPSIPTATGQAISTNEDIPIGPISLTGTDPIDGDALIFKCTPPSHGLLAGCNGGTYTPNKGFAGPDSFSFTVVETDASGGTVSSTPPAIVAIKVIDTSKPTANGAALNTNENTPTAPFVAGTDPDAAADGTPPLTFTLVTGPANGKLAGCPAACVYTPKKDFAGPDAFTFTVSEPDGNGGTVKSDQATVTITVTDTSKPTANGAALNIDENTPTAPFVAGTDLDDAADGNPALTFVLVNGPANGNLAGCPAACVYTPKLDFAGPDAFTFTVSEPDPNGGPPIISNQATVTLKVIDTSIPTADDQGIPISEKPGQVPFALGGADNVDFDPVTFSIVNGPSHGNLSCDPAGACTYNPGPTFESTDIITFTADEPDGFGGTIASDPATVTITVQNPSLPMLAPNPPLPIITNENTATAPIGLKTIIIDPDNDPLGFLCGKPANGVLVGCDGGIYTPNKDFAGPDSFMVTATEADTSGQIVSSQIPITINVMDTSKPIANAAAKTTVVNTPVPILLTGADPDAAADGNPVLVFNVTPPGPANGILAGAGCPPACVYTPNINFVGTDSFTFTTSEPDGNGGNVVSAPATVTITVGTSTTLTKTANVTSGFAPLAVNYTYTETNTGTDTISGPAIQDNKCSPATFVSDSDADGGAVLDPGESMTFSCITTLSATTTNKANATGTLPTGAAAPNETASATVTILDSSKTVQSATGAGLVTFSTNAGGFSNLAAVAQSGLLPPPPPGSYPFGFFSWSITGFAPATSVKITVTFPSAVPPSTQYLKLIGGTWVLVPITINSNTITMTIQDNGPLDADSTVGTISDPGGLLVTTAGGTQQLINMINGMDLQAGITKNLDWKLQGVISSLHLGQNSGAKNQLNAFINFVNTQAGKTIPQAQAATIVQDAQNIIRALS